MHSSEGSRQSPGPIFELSNSVWQPRRQHHSNCFRGAICKQWQAVAVSRRHHTDTLQVNLNEPRTKQQPRKTKVSRASSERNRPNRDNFLRCATKPEQHNTPSLHGVPQNTARPARRSPSPHNAGPTARHTAYLISITTEYLY